MTNTEDPEINRPVIYGPHGRVVSRPPPTEKHPESPDAASLPGPPSCRWKWRRYVLNGTVVTIVVALAIFAFQEYQRRQDREISRSIETRSGDSPEIATIRPEDIEALRGVDEEDKEKLKDILGLLAQNDADSALRVLAEIQGKYRDLATVYFLEGNIRVLSSDWSTALDAWATAVRLKHDFPEAWNNRGAALANLGRYEEAVASYDSALVHKPCSV